MDYCQNILKTHLIHFLLRIPAYFAVNLRKIFFFAKEIILCKCFYFSWKSNPQFFFQCLRNYDNLSSNLSHRSQLLRYYLKMEILIIEFAQCYYFVLFIFKNFEIWLNFYFWMRKVDFLDLSTSASTEIIYFTISNQTMTLLYFSKYCLNLSYYHFQYLNFI